MPLKAVLFDMDGVIVDTEPLHKKAYFEMFQHYNLPVTEDMFNAFTGKTTLSICNELIRFFNLSINAQKLVEKKRECFKFHFDHDPDFDLIPGVKDLIKNYHQNGVKMILASSASMKTIDWVFERFKLTEYFMDKISGAELAQSKPHPEIFELAASLSGEEKRDCMVIEDSTNGIQAAYNAGIFCVAYKSPNSHNQHYALAQKIIGDYREIYWETSNEWFGL